MKTRSMDPLAASAPATRHDPAAPAALTPAGAVHGQTIASHDALVAAHPPATGAGGAWTGRG